jgi:DNA-binding transcriptional LysR family regulator
MELRQLRTFRTVATYLSFNQAAEQLNYAQSSVSAQIHALEEELCVSLFDRLGRGIRLTEAGERLLQYAEKILDLADESRSEIAETRETQGALTIRVPESSGIWRLSQVIGRYVGRYPAVRLDFTTCAHETLQKALRKGITDLAFLLTESLQVADLDTEVLGFESIVMVASPDHPLARRRTVHSRDLAGEVLLLSRVDCSYRLTLERLLAEAGIVPQNVHTFHSVEILKRCAMNGSGITVLPQIAVADDLAAGRLVRLKWRDAFEVALLMIWYRERWRSPALEAFMATTREVLKAGQATGTTS